MADSVFLVGMMAAGKSTVGRLVAERLGFAFYDSDKVIEERAGADISWIFDREGEEGFRDREELVLDELSQADDVVLATGGGAVLRKRNRCRMKTRGAVVYLASAPEVIAERVHRDGRRPLLNVDDVESRIDALCEEREPLYRDVAHVVVEIGRRPARVVATDVIDALAATGAARFA